MIKCKYESLTNGAENAFQFGTSGKPADDIFPEFTVGCDSRGVDDTNGCPETSGPTDDCGWWFE